MPLRKPPLYPAELRGRTLKSLQNPSKSNQLAHEIPTTETFIGADHTPRGVGVQLMKAPHPRRRPGLRRRGGGGLQAPAIERFKRLQLRYEGGCWEWIGALNSRGYGCFAIGGKGRTQLAHRWSYSYYVEAIPAGMTIDHLCRNRRCVNPAHLEAVTRAENTRRYVVGLLAAKRLIERGYFDDGGGR